LANLGVEGLEIRGVCRRLGSTKHIGRARQQLLLPVRDLRGVDLKVLRNSASVLSPLTAANATCALNVAL
jgi:hypothetical protein